MPEICNKCRWKCKIVLCGTTKTLHHDCEIRIDAGREYLPINGNDECDYFEPRPKPKPHYSNMQRKQIIEGISDKLNKI